MTGIEMKSEITPHNRGFSLKIKIKVVEPKKQEQIFLSEGERAARENSRQTESVRGVIVEG